MIKYPVFKEESGKLVGILKKSKQGESVIFRIPTPDKPLFKGTKYLATLEQLE